jgi:predicted dehydrogenase
MVRIGFVGVGMMGQAAHLRHYASIPDCQIVALAEPRLELARRVAERFGVPRFFSSAEDMFEEVELDGIVAIQQFDRHGSVVKPLYRFGKPLLTEKPLASSIAVGEAMLDSLRAGGSWHMVGYHKRNDLAVRWALSEVARRPEIGALRYVRITMPPGDWIGAGFEDVIRSDERPRSTAADHRDPGLSEEQFREYVAFVNYYIHQVNLLRLFTGSYKVVFASEKLLAVQTGAITGAIEMAPYTTELGWDEEILLGFENAHIRIRLPAPVAPGRAGQVSLHLNGVTVEPDLEPKPAMRRQAENFVAAIAGTEKPACEAAEALEDLRIAGEWLRLKVN